MSAFRLKPDLLAQSLQCPLSAKSRRRSVGRFLWMSAAPRRLNRGDVDLLHSHYRVKGAFGFIAAGREGVGHNAWRDLPGDAPLVFAPAAGALLAGRVVTGRTVNGAHPAAGKRLGV